MNLVTLTCWGYYQILNISVSLSLSLLLSDVGVNQIAAGLGECGHPHLLGILPDFKH